jgi:hypothetical protein
LRASADIIACSSYENRCPPFCGARIDLTTDWQLSLRGDLPFVAKDPLNSSNPSGDYLYGVGDADLQAALIHDIDARWKAGFGVLGSLHGWRQARPHWEFAAELILKGARTGRRADVDAAAQQVERALGCDGWL